MKRPPLPNLIILIAIPIITFVIYYLLDANIRPYGYGEIVFSQEYLNEARTRLVWNFLPFFATIYCVSFGGIVYGFALRRKQILFLISGLAIGWPILFWILSSLLSVIILNINLGIKIEEYLLLIIALIGIISGLIILIKNNLFLRNQYKVNINIFSITAIILNSVWIWKSYQYLEEIVSIYFD